MERSRFWKMHGAGNDFIVLVQRGQPRWQPAKPWIQAICKRRTGVGSDGVIVLRSPAGDAHLEMLFYNPDGTEAELCGNGARCAARLAFELGLAPAAMRMTTKAGMVQATVENGHVGVCLPAAYDLRAELNLCVEDVCISSFINSGVPHAIAIMPDMETLLQMDVNRPGRCVREHPMFRPDGTNVDFIAIESSDTLRIRTYERGVERETLACGTGCVAAAVAAAHAQLVQLPCRLRVASGAMLTVQATLTTSGADAVCLRGPAAHVFDGFMETPE